jgi:cell division protein FtsB
MTMSEDLKARVAMLEEHIDKLNEQSAVLYEQGWNAGLEMAAFKLQHEFKQAFGPDTLVSVAVYVKGLKK